MKLENLNDSKFENFAKNEIADLGKVKGGNMAREETGAVAIRLDDGTYAGCGGDVKIDGVLVLGFDCK